MMEFVIVMCCSVTCSVTCFNSTVTVYQYIDFIMTAVGERFIDFWGTQGS